ncbi:hypothetical protein [Paenibacillus phytorum]|uniref:hypothetical protein n=1 Tax=Paenibacillus phytorum TaxID=2654977 RepID=UPI001492185C|nr:hypothetical protein [Paenibacillus phytorum]
MSIALPHQSKSIDSLQLGHITSAKMKKLLATALIPLQTAYSNKIKRCEYFRQNIKDFSDEPYHASPFRQTLSNPISHSRAAAFLNQFDAFLKRSTISLFYEMETIINELPVMLPSVKQSILQHSKVEFLSMSALI